MIHKHWTGKIVLAVLTVTILALLLVTAVQCAQLGRKSGRGTAGRPAETPLESVPFDGAQVVAYTRQLCALGPRPTASPGMKAQQEFLDAHFRPLADSVELLPFTFPHPETPGVTVPGANFRVRWRPERPERILLCAHYDTLPLALLDPPAARRPFLGANDSAACVAILMELGKKLPEILSQDQTRYGVDVVFFDAEEFMFRPHGRFCIGSEAFARQYAAAAGTRDYRYVCGILLDICTYHKAVLRMEQQSARWRDTRPIVQEVWGVAQDLGVREFRRQMGTEVLDDHVPLRNLGKIPVIDIIDLDYPMWHTSADTPEQVSPLVAARVGWVVQEWLRTRE